MKAMKKLMIVAATLTLSTSAFYAVACNDENEHEHKYSWSVTTPATCENDGEEKGVCEICGDETTRTVSATGHSYGNWYVTAPSREQTGKAIRVCATDAAHTDEVDLPALPVSGNGAYKSVTPISNSNASTYVYDNNGTEISFKGYSYDKTSISTAVAIAAETNSEAISNNSTHGSITHGTGATSSSAVNLEFGDGYVHIVDDSQSQEMWYEKQEDGSSFNALKFYDRLGNQSVKLDERRDASQMYDGYGYYFVWIYSDHYDYGAGNFINYYYQQAQNNPNGDFVESYKEVDGKTVYSFGYSVYDTTYYTEAAGGDHLNVMSFEFTLASNGVVETLTAKNETYINAKETQGEGPTGGTVTNPAVTNFVQDTDGNWRLVPDASVSFTETWTMTQQTALNPGEELPTTPYHYEDMLATSFDLMQVRANANFEVTDELGLLGDEVTVNPTVALCLALTNIAPSSANFYIDDIKFYWRTVDEDGKNVDKLLSAHYGNGEDWNVKVAFDPVTNVLIVNPYVAGDITLVIKTAKVEKIVTLHVPKTNPTEISSSVYDYDVETETFKWDSLNNYFRIYQGEELCFKSNVTHPAYQEDAYTATVSGPSEVVLGTDFKQGEEVSVFKATETGLYTVTITSKVTDVSSTFQVKVLAAPNEAKLLSGEYKGVDDNKNDVLVTFDTENKLASISIGEDGSVYKADLEYTYTAATEDEAPTLIVANDPNSEYTFVFEVTSGYEVLLNYSDGFGMNCRVYISNAVKNAVTGTYTLSSSRNKHTVNVGGQYAISASSTFFYALNGVTVKNEATGGALSVNNIVLELEEGEVFEIWYLSSGTYKVTLYNPVNSVVINEPATKQIVVGGSNLTLSAECIGLEADNDVSFTTVTWSSSDTNIATVSSKGVVTAKAAGTVTITATSTNNTQAAATIELTVTYINATSVTLNKETAEMKVGGDNLKLEATVGAENASDKSVVWTSSDENVATVVGGVVTVNPNLSADDVVTITATSVDSTDGNVISASCTITVKYIAATGVTLDKETADMVIGVTDPITLKATVGPADASNKKVVWTSSDESVATVDENGKVTLKDNLTADAIVTITATSAANGKFKATCTINVKYVAVTTVTLNTSATTVSVGGTTTLSATLKGADDTLASNRNVTWTSSNPDVVSVDENGKVTVNADYRTDGTEVTVTATSVADNTKTATCVITVKYVPVATFEIASNSKAEYELGIGKTQSLYLNMKDADGKTAYTVKGVKWESDNEFVTVTGTATTGTVKVSANLRESVEVTVTATALDNPELKVTFTITVNYVPVESVTLNYTEAEMEVGGSTLRLNATLVGADEATPSVTGMTWTSSNTDVATVSTGGVVTVKNTLTENTTVTIRVTATDNPDKYAECVITVKYVPVESVTVANSEVALKVGEGASAKATVVPANASVKTFTYTSSDESIATVDANGVIKAVKAGTATITATSTADTSKKATVTVNVSAAIVAEGANSLSVAMSTTVIYEFTGKPDTLYTFTSSVTVVGVSKDAYAYGAKSSLRGTTDSNGKFKVAVNAPYNFQTYDVTLTIAEFVPPVGGDGSYDFPYDLTVGEERTFLNVGGGWTGQSYVGGKLVITEEGDYTVTSSNAELLIGSALTTGYVNVTGVENQVGQLVNGSVVHLSAGTYYIAIGVYNGWWTEDVTFTVTKV